MDWSFYAIDRFERGPTNPAGNDAKFSNSAYGTTKTDSDVKLILQTKIYATSFSAFGTGYRVI
jgi:hypothetical protein